MMLVNKKHAEQIEHFEKNPNKLLWVNIKMGVSWNGKKYDCNENNKPKWLKQTALYWTTAKAHNCRIEIEVAKTSTQITTKHANEKCTIRTYTRQNQ